MTFRKENADKSPATGFKLNFCAFAAIWQWMIIMNHLCSIKPALQISINIHYTLFSIITLHNLWCLCVATSPAVRTWELALCLITVYVNVPKLHLPASDVKQSIRGSSPARFELEELESRCYSCFSKGKSYFISHSEGFGNSDSCLFRAFIDQMPTLGICVTLACSEQCHSALLNEEWVLSFTPCSVNVKHVEHIEGKKTNGRKLN